MSAYIQAFDTLLLQAGRIAQPPEAELRAVTRMLSQSPVVGYVPFAETEVSLIGVYRSSIGRRYNPVHFDPVWRDIVAGVPEAWTYAVHKAAEIQAFVDLGANPFDYVQFDRYLEDAHRHAVVNELRFQQAWAAQVGFDMTELALETANRLRGQFPGHARFVQQLQLHQGWPTPSDEQQQSAEQFWLLLLRGDLK